MYDCHSGKSLIFPHAFIRVNPQISFKACQLLNGLLPSKEAKDQLTAKHIERLYVFALMWSAGAFLELDDRTRLQDYIFNHPDANFRLDTPKLSAENEDTIFDYFVHEKTGTWTHWNTVVTEYIYPKDHDPEYATILVPNVDNVRTDFLIHTIAKQHKVNLTTIKERKAAFSFV